MSVHRPGGMEMINFHDIHFRTEFTLWFECIVPIPPDIATKLKPETLVDFYTEDNRYYLSCQQESGEPFNTILKLRPMQESNEDFEFMLTRQCHFLALFQTMSSSGEILLRILVSNGSLLRHCDIEIALRSDLVRKFREEFKCSSDDDITRALRSELGFEHNNGMYFIFDGNVDPFVAGPDDDGAARKFAFSIVGSRHKLSITSSHIGSKQILLAYAWKRCNTLSNPLCSPSIFKGEWNCRQQRHLVREIQDNLFEQRYQTQDSYFHNWNEYLNGYLDFILDSTRMAGFYRITDCSLEDRLHREYRIRLEASINEKFCAVDDGKDINIWVSEKVPAFFSQENLRGIDYLHELLIASRKKATPAEDVGRGDFDENESSLDKLDDNEDPNEDEEYNDEEVAEDLDGSTLSEEEKSVPRREYQPNYRGRLRLPSYIKTAIIKEMYGDGRELRITMTGRSAPPRKGDCICLSLSGYFTNAMRCLAARDSIQKWECGNPQLRSIIEDLETFSGDTGNFRRHKLSSYVRNKIFPKNPPTPNQLEAIEMALNTPDILLIQGPPGTGKTTVIAAIIESLNELQDAQGNNCGKILVSAFQHAAVDNIVSRLSINDLPGYKFGQRDRNDRNKMLEFDPAIFESWRCEAIRKMESAYANLKESQMQTDLESLYLKYIAAPTAGCALKILDFLLEQATSSEMLQQRPRIEALRLRYQGSDLTDEEGMTYQHLVRALRTEEESFNDDGADRAYDLAHSPFARRLTDEQRTLLDRASDWLPGDPQEFLPELKELKEELLSQFVAIPEGNSQDADNELCDLYNTCSEIIDREQRSGADEMEDIIRDLYLNLKNSPLLTRDALQSYTFALAATIQKAADNNINLLRGESKYDDIRFDTVIVDEAARANPPDLLIPMSQAVKRIILVGDHRQLPHIIEEEVLKRNELEFKQAQNSGGDSDGGEPPFLLNPKILRHSLFQHLWENLEKKHRTITLNIQFRMHPLLGNFVSRYFYKMQGDSGFDSGLEPSSCKHGLQDIKTEGLYEPNLEKKALVWFDVQGEKDKSDGSRYRECEATALVAKLKSWMDSEAGRGLSFGIITFYRSQVREINSALDRIGIGIHADKGEFRDEYKYLPPEEGEVARKERLQVGTVDAFQGKEFDVVLLSLVHSSAPGKKIAENADGIKLFNRICTSEETNASKNLLCVALSRQKKLLAVFGDRRLFASKAAEKHSRELHQLLKLSDVENNGDLCYYEL